MHHARKTRDQNIGHGGPEREHVHVVDRYASILQRTLDGFRGKLFIKMCLSALAIECIMTALNAVGLEDPTAQA
jgi:hypothetical protein